MYTLPLYNYIFICLYKNIPTLKYRIGIKIYKVGECYSFPYLRRRSSTASIYSSLKDFPVSNFTNPS